MPAIAGLSCFTGLPKLGVGLFSLTSCRRIIRSYKINLTSKCSQVIRHYPPKQKLLPTPLLPRFLHLKWRSSMSEHGGTFGFQQIWFPKQTRSWPFGSRHPVFALVEYYRSSTLCQRLDLGHHIKPNECTVAQNVSQFDFRQVPGRLCCWGVVAIGRSHTPFSGGSNDRIPSLDHKVCFNILFCCICYVFGMNCSDLRCFSRSFRIFFWRRTPTSKILSKIVVQSRLMFRS